MSKRTAAMIGAVVTATLLIAGIAWASGSDDSPNSTITPSTSTSLDDDGSSASVEDNSTSTTVEDNTSTSSAGSRTSTTIDDNTSSTIDDDDGNDVVDDNNSGDDDDDVDDDSQGKDDDEDEVSAPAADGVHIYDVAGVGTVTVSVVSGQLQLVDVQPNAVWSVEVKKAQADKINVRFRNSENEAEFEAELEHGGIKIEVEVAH